MCCTECWNSIFDSMLTQRRDVWMAAMLHNTYATGISTDGLSVALSNVSTVCERHAQRASMYQSPMKSLYKY